MTKGASFLLFIIFSVKLFAQIEKGTLMTGVLINGNYTTTPFKDTLYTQTNYKWNCGANVGFGTFIKNNLLLIVKADYSLGYSENKTLYNSPFNYFNNNEVQTNTNSITPSIILSKYFFVTEKMAFSLGAGISSSYSKAISVTTYYDWPFVSNPYTLTSKQNILAFQVNLLAGIYYFITKNIAISGNMCFFPLTYTEYPSKTNVQKQGFSFNNGNVFSNYGIGITYYLRHKVTTK